MTLPKLKGRGRNLRSDFIDLLLIIVTGRAQLGLMIQPEDFSKERPKLYFPSLQRNDKIHCNSWDRVPSSIVPHIIYLKTSASGPTQSRCSAC